MESNAFRDRVRLAAEAALEANGAVGPLELFQQMRLLNPVHVEAWRKGHESYRTLEPWIQVGAEKLRKTRSIFAEWIKERDLSPTEIPYTRRTLQGTEPLQVTVDGDPQREQFYRTRYVPSGLPPAKAKRLSAKLTKAPDLVVFEKVGDEGNCVDCGVELAKGSYLFMEKGQALCLACADLDHLVFLPAGDTGLSRRARKHSPLSAVVVRFNRSRRRYERQGLLVAAAALAKAEEECTADAPERARRRAQAAVAREAEDVQFVRQLCQSMQRLYPACPLEEIQAIARFTGERGSGRVGRSAAAQELDETALTLAVRAHVRHTHTNYDQLLMQGVERLEARALVRDKIEQVLAAWSGT